MKKLEAVIPKILSTKKGRKAFNDALAKAFKDSKQQKRVVTDSCPDCGKPMRLRKGTLVLQDREIGKFSVPKVEWEECKKCKSRGTPTRLFSGKTCRAIDLRRREVLKRRSSENGHAENQ
jgi:endogenous inhibitor of DNA gyrase (YacG/DUF329 family)